MTADGKKLNFDIGVHVHNRIWGSSKEEKARLVNQSRVGNFSRAFESCTVIGLIPNHGNFLLL